MPGCAGKLRFVLRRELALGAKIAQAVHGAIAYALKYPEDILRWVLLNNTVVILEVPGEELDLLRSKLSADDQRYAFFQEPDLDHQLTCLVLAPEPEMAIWTKKLPLARG
jgi:hypothetical protein